MSQYLDGNGNPFLQFSLPKSKLMLMLAELGYPGVENISKMSFEERRIVLLASFREFLKGNLLLEEFSEIASALKKSFPAETQTPEKAEYELMIFEATDLSLYARQFTHPAESMFAGFMGTVWDYFNKYKHLLENLPSKYSTPASFFEEAQKDASIP